MSFFPPVGALLAGARPVPAEERVPPHPTRLRKEASLGAEAEKGETGSDKQRPYNHQRNTMKNPQGRRELIACKPCGRRCTFSV